ncbi:hypothetical protein DM860_016001 [Cuscuta australis]|uniref:Uncharacterized protein n=1 Tax=Cuscuta australis TaxID=267555 RepID=A0A328DMF3_9ASTE|nr:hypothetical protein DM860_016001 [Cuscuta australis]
MASRDCPDHVTLGNDDLNSDPKFGSLAADSANHNENKDDFDFHGSTPRLPGNLIPPTSLAPLGNDERKSDPVTTYPNKYTEAVHVSTAPDTPVQLSTINLDVQTSTVSKCIPTGCSSAPTTNQFDPLEDIPDDDPLLEEHLEDDLTLVRSKKANKKEAPDMTIQTRSGRAPHGPRGQNPQGRCRGRHGRGAI